MGDSDQGVSKPAQVYTDRPGEVVVNLEKPAESTEELANLEGQIQSENQQEPEQPVADSQSENKTYDWSGRKLTADEMFEEATKLQKEFTQRSQRLKEMERETVNKPEPVEEQAMDETQKAQLRKVIQEAGFVTKEEIEQKVQQDERARAIRSERTELEGKYKGEDGKPKFEYEDVLRFAVDNGMPNLDLAYRELNHDKLLDWEISQRTTAKPPYSEKPGASTPKEGMLGSKDYDKMSVEELEAVLPKAYKTQG